MPRLRYPGDGDDNGKFWNTELILNWLRYPGLGVWLRFFDDGNDDGKSWDKEPILYPGLGTVPTATTTGNPRTQS